MIKEKIKFVLNNHFNSSDNKISLQELKLNDIHASVSLSAIDVGFIPQSSYSMSPTLILHILNDIIINQRKSIVEFGSGVSTIYMAKAIKDKGLKAKVYSIDEDEKWQDIIKGSLKQLDCDDFVVFITAPIRSDDVGAPWFNEDKINESLSSNQCSSFDCVLVDAPSTRTCKTIRNKAIPFILSMDYLSSNFSIFVDDTYRLAEHTCANEWNKSLDQSKLEDYDTYSVITSGYQYVSRPVYHGHSYQLSEFIGRNKPNKN